ncbi:universal stress protein [Fulvivirga sp. 29W222]|uniref:Universal stress protein n=1 Tax=Fulvivirga marina TaxID=2494733 RepID=A0A937KE50_9BACT|nr:universal stress protein [Fulvivirga marina]MBL6449357.1 universal stress protein [Fulvivirga marina]
MFKSIICPVDFSESSANALSFALDIAQSNQSELVVLYTYRLISGTDDKAGANRISLKRQQEEIANKRIEELKKRFPEFEQVRHTFLAEVGFINDRLAMAIEKYNVDLIVLTENIKMRLKERWEDGDESVLARFNCPVLLIPSKEVREETAIGSG